MVSKNKLVVKNSIFLLSRTVFLTVITLYTLREILSILGAEGFGLYSVIFGVVAMFSFINNAMMSATQRYLGFEIGRKNFNDIKNTFITSCFIHILLAFLLSGIIFLTKDVFLNNILNINKYKSEAEIIYNLALISIFISILQVPFSALITAYEKMQAFAYLALFEGIAKLFVVYLLYCFEYNKVILYSILLTSISFIVFILHIIYCYLNFYEILKLYSVKFREIKSIFSSMFNFMGWSLIGNLAVVMKNHGSNILLNIFFGVIANSAFSISLTIVGAVSNLIASVSNAIKPQIFKNYAENNLDEFFNLINYGTKYYMYMISAIVFPLIFCMDYILVLWLRNIPEHTIIFCRLALILVLVDALATLLVAAIQATGEIKWNQIVTGTLLCITIPISYILFKCGFSAEYIFYVSITISLLAIFSRVVFLIRLTRYNILNYIKRVLFPVLMVQFLICLSMFIWQKLLGNPSDIYSFLIFLAVTGISNILLLYIIGLSKSEKVKLKKMVNL